MGAANATRTLILNRRGEPVSKLGGSRFGNILAHVDTSTGDYLSTVPVECFLSNSLDLMDLHRILEAEGLVWSPESPQGRAGNFRPKKKAVEEGWVDADNCWEKKVMDDLLKKYRLSPAVKGALVNWIGAESIVLFLGRNISSRFVTELPSIPEAMNDSSLCLEALYGEIARMISAEGWKVSLKHTMERIHDIADWMASLNAGFRPRLLKDGYLKKSIAPRKAAYLRPYFQRTELTGAHNAKTSLKGGVPWQIETIVAIAGKYNVEAIPFQAIDYYSEPLPETSLPPLFPWAGGKSKQVPLIYIILRMLGPSVSRIVDPFCGALSIPLGVGLQKGTINDVNPSIVNYYRMIQKGWNFGIHSIRTKSYPKGIPHRLTKDIYHEVRNLLNEIIREYYLSAELGIRLPPETQKTWAAAFYVVAKGSFNGLWRENRSGGQNVPSRVKTGDSYLIDWPQLDKYKAFLKGYNITCGDYKKVKTGGEESLLYIDPPYVGTFANYNKGGFTEDDHEALIEWAAAHQGPVVMNNSNWKALGPIYSKHGFLVTPYQSRTTISAKQAGRREVSEVLVIKNMRFPDGSI